MAFWILLLMPTVKSSKETRRIMGTRKHVLKLCVPSVSFFLSYVVKLFCNFKMLWFNPSGSLSYDTVELESDEGQKLLSTSSFQENHELLFKSFEKQIWLSYCGVASATMILNAIEADTTYVQLGVSNSRRKQVIVPPKAFMGMTLKQLGELLQVHSFSTQIFHADNVDSEQFRDLAIQALKRPKSFVIVNYSRRALGQKGWGHFSPLSAYHSVADRFLVIDVAKEQKHSSAWVNSEALYSALYTKDISSRRFRGFIIATKQY